MRSKRCAVQNQGITLNKLRLKYRTTRGISMDASTTENGIETKGSHVG